MSFALILFILLGFICAVFGQRYETKLFGTQPRYIKENVYITDNDTNITKEVTLPYKLPINYSGKYTITTTLDKYYNDDTNSIAVNIKNMSIDVLVDDLYIYSSRFEDTMDYSKTNGENLHIIKLNDDYYGKDLKINVQMLLKKGVDYVIDPLFIGSKFDICIQVFKDQSFEFIMVIINVILVSVCLIFILLFRKNVKDTQIDQLYFGCLFVIIYSCSIFFGMTISNFFVANSYLRYVMQSIGSMLLYVPIMFMYKYNGGKRSNRVLDVLIMLCLLNYFVQTMLNFSHIIDYASMVLITSYINYLCFFSMMIITFIMFKSKKNVQKSFYLSMLFIAIGTILDSIGTIIQGKRYYLSSQICVIIFALIQIIVTGKTLLNYYKMGVRSNIYHQMAYTDNMTNMGNRLAFDTEISVLEETREQFNNIWCVVIDINNLKHVNDNLGHQTGDWLISSVAQIINVAFEDFGKTYRIGGDEFVVMAFDRPEEEMNEKIEYIHKLTNEANSVCDEFQISVAIGFDKRDAYKNEKIKELFSRVDKLMYENKSYIKAKILSE